jgi:hypothetical protein
VRLAERRELGSEALSFNFNDLHRIDNGTGQSLSTIWAFPGSPHDFNPSNPPVRTRMPGGVAGDAKTQPSRPYADRFSAFFSTRWE